MSDGRPTRERPLLIGLLVDVSGSMMSSIRNTTGKDINRLQGFRDALAELVKRAGNLSQGGASEKVAPLLKLFAYGFGFGNPLSALFGGGGPRVRDLLEVPGGPSSTVPLDLLTRDWSIYRSHVEGLALEMLGNTPMREGFELVRRRLRVEATAAPYFGQPIVFVLSDGEPTDATPSEVREIAAAIKSSGTLVVSCYVTSDDITAPRHLYAAPLPHWPPGAALMLECASPVPLGSPFSSYLKEWNWTVEADGRLFTQVNQSDVLSEFMNLVLSPLENRPGQSQNRRAIRVFVSYSHADVGYVSPSGLLGYLSGLNREGVEFWHDERLIAGDAWDAKIREEIATSDIALVLTSQSFLNSAYCQDTEVSAFLERRVSDGLVIFPVLIAPCDWKSHRWLSSTQFEPRGGKTIESDFKDRGSRDALYLDILNQLRTIAESIRSARNPRGGG